MDAEIVKHNGETFRLSDFGIVYDFVVHSIPLRQSFTSVDGRSGTVDDGAQYGQRRISVPMKFKAEDLHDYAHLRDVLYGKLVGTESFYIREMRRLNTLQYEFRDFGQKPKWSNQTDNNYVNGKQYLVRLDGEVSPEQIVIGGEISLEFVTTELPFAESTYTTLELHDTGYSATAEKYGLVDNIDDEKVQYRFEGTPYKPNLLSDSGVRYENANPNIANYPINTSLSVGEQVTVSIYGQLGVGRVSFALFNTSGGSSDYSLGRVFPEDFDSDLGAYVATFTWPIGSNDSLRVIQQPGSGTSNSLINRIKLEKGSFPTPYIDPGATGSEFKVYNAGNVTIEPESMLLNIFISHVYSEGNFTIRNKTTGEEIILQRESNGSHFRVNGMVISLGSITNIFRDTNRRFISLAPGDNEIEVLNGTFDEIRFEFKYLYK